MPLNKRKTRKQSDPMTFLPKCVNMEETLIDTCSIYEDLTSKNNFQMTVEMDQWLMGWLGAAG